MRQTGDVQKYDIVIIGAGPAGCAAALTLKNSGKKVALLDKTSFPRDKVCGDAIPGRAITILKSIDPAFEAAFKKFPKKQEAKRTTLHFKEKELTFDWVQEAYTCTRLEFDNFLFSLVKENTATTIYTDIVPDTITINDDSVSISIKNSTGVLKAPIIIGADGAHSVVAKQLTNKTLDRDHHVGSVRAYYSNIQNIDNSTTHIYFDKRFLPSYLWVFPLYGNTANVGFGMLSSEIVKRKINLKKTFYEFIDNAPGLKTKLKEATQVSALEGFGLPLGSKPGVISGDRFMLTGDAASLIDPISGDGIGNAMLSGKLAAQQALQCFEQNNFTAPAMKAYDKALFDKIGGELKSRYKAQRMLSAMPVMLDILFLAGRNKILKKLIQKRL